MPINFTSIANGAAANATTFNNPLTELDNAIKKNNYAATGAPTTGDDSGDGYSVGSRWCDTTNDKLYTCLDATTNAAVWKQSVMANFTGNVSLTGDLTVTGDAVLASGSSKKVYIHDSSNANQTVGLTINMGGASNEIVSLKSGSVSHGMTALTEDDTFGALGKVSATPGGLALFGYTTATAALQFSPRATTEDATRSTAGRAFVEVNSSIKSGTGGTTPSADKNNVAFRVNGTTRQIFDTDGDSHQDVGTAWTNYDDHNDIALLNKLAAHVSRKDDPLRNNFGSWLKQNRKELENLKLVKFNRDGHHFVNMSRLTMLLVGAMRQLGERMEQIENANRGTATKRITKPKRASIAIGKRKTTGNRNRKPARGVV